MPEELGRFLEVKVCKSCGWFDKPPPSIDSYPPLPWLKYSVCPECGSHDLQYEVGRYKYHVSPATWFHCSRSTVIGFVKKDGPYIPQPTGFET